jgi:hypothetical protein
MNVTPVLLASAAAITLAAPAHAASTIIAGPGSYGVGATTVAEEPDLAGLVLEDRIQDFTIDGAAGGLVSGFIQERVVRSNDTGFLHFHYRAVLEEISGFDLGSYVEWLEFDPVATGDPLAVGRKTDGLGSPTGSSYDLAATGQSRFDFNLIDLDDGNAGFSTQFHVIKTNAIDYALTGQLRLSGFEFIGFDAEGIASDWLPTFAAVVVPEPRTWAIMVAGFGLAGLAMRRRRATRAAA